MSRHTITAALASLLAAGGLSACTGQTDGAGAGADTPGSGAAPPGVFALVPDAPGGFTDLAGTAELTDSAGGGSDVSIALSGLKPNVRYLAHVHEGTCNQPDPGGPHFKFDPGGTDTPPNEIHLRFASNATRHASARVHSARRVGAGAAGSVVVHLDAPANPAAAAAGTSTPAAAAGHEHHAAGSGTAAAGAAGGHSHAAKIACAALRASGPPAAQAGPASRLTTGSAPLVAAPVSPAAAQAHDIAGGESLPLPSWLLAWAASAVLVISFVGLAVLWPSPRLARARERRLLALPRWLDGVAGVLHASRLPSGLAGGPGAAFDLADARGGRIAARALRGRPYALTFLYTPCPDVCRQTSTTRSDPTRNSGRSATRTTRRLSWLDDRRRAPRPQPSGSSTPAAGCERRTPPGLR